MAANLTIPTSITDGQPLSAAPVKGNFDAVATWVNTNTVQLDGSKPMTGELVGTGADPTSANQYARKAYVDAIITGTGIIGATQLATNAVTTIKITDANVTTAKIADGNVTKAKLSTASGELGGAWVSTALTYSNITGGIGTCFVMAMGKTLFFRVEITAGVAAATGLATFNITGYTPKTATQPFMATGYLAAQGVKANATAVGFTWGQDNVGSSFPSGNSIVGVFSGVVEVN